MRPTTINSIAQNAYLIRNNQAIVCSHALATRLFSSDSDAVTSSNAKQSQQQQQVVTNNKLLKVAIVGGGPAGLCAALQLAPLVSKGYIQAPIDVFEAASDCCSTTAPNTIGVGIWSTALLAFLQQDNDKRPSYQMLLQKLQSIGNYVQNVGYRTPDGSWLTQSSLSAPTSTKLADLCPPSNSNNNDQILLQEPFLLFLQQHSLVQALKDSIEKMEQQNIQIHYEHTVQLIVEQNDYEATLRIKEEVEEGKCNSNSNPPVYNLILVAEGMNSNLRKRYSRHFMDDDTTTSTSLLANDDIEDRGFTVFRGNAILPSEMTATINSSDSFQTWGEKQSMRFAAVPCPILVQINDLQQKKLGYTWFFTTDDPALTTTTSDDDDKQKKKDQLLKSLSNWHDPICQLIQSTSANDIIMDRAFAHCDSAAALGTKFDNKQLEQIPLNRQPPLVCYIGDSDMTVDPVLAQGITIGMEDAADIARCVERAALWASSTPLLMDALQKELLQRYQKKQERLTCLLRATKLVQGLAQPSGAFTGIIARSIVRPLMKYCVPNIIKTQIFHRAMNYSLGLFLRK